MGDRSRSRSPERSGKSTGVALRWNPKGFGFIKPDDGSEDLFCHFSSITDGKMLKEGSKVQFKKQYDERKGKDRAEEVTGGIPEEDLFGGGGGGGRGGGGGGGVSGPPPPGKMQGVAKRWNEKGFGFIGPDDGGEESAPPGLEPVAAPAAPRAAPAPHPHRMRPSPRRAHAFTAGRILVLVAAESWSVGDHRGRRGGRIPHHPPAPAHGRCPHGGRGAMRIAHTSISLSRAAHCALRPNVPRRVPATRARSRGSRLGSLSLARAASSAMRRRSRTATRSWRGRRCTL